MHKSPLVGKGGLEPPRLSAHDPNLVSRSPSPFLLLLCLARNCEPLLIGIAFAEDSVAKYAHGKRLTFWSIVHVPIEAPEVTGYAKYATFREEHR